MRSEDNLKHLRRLIITKTSTIRLLITIFIRKKLSKAIRLSMINLGNKLSPLMKRLATVIKQLKARTLLKISTIHSQAHFLRKR